MKRLSPRNRLSCWLPHFFAVLVLLVLASQNQKLPADEKIDFFENKIRPVLVKHCYQCHSTKAKKVKGDLLLDSKAGMLKGGDSGPAIVVGEPAESNLIKALKYDGYEMPPDGKLSEAIIADFENWISAGAVDPRTGDAPLAASAINYDEALKFWSFQPLSPTDVPKIRARNWAVTDIDRYILSSLEKQKLSPAGPAAPGALLRRAYFDLVGLPPSPDQLQAFLSDETEDAFEKVIDQLLKSPQYGERWGRHWLDVARYGEDQAHTFKARKYPLGYRYRDWVVAAINQDMPYDQFLVNQIAGDLTGEPDRHERLAALGLFALGPVYYQDNGEKAKALADEWDDRVDTLTRGILGLTVSCARCHDHKFDPITMRDYYGLTGIFSSSQYRERPIAPDQVIAARKVADDALKEQQLVIDRYLADQARKLRPTLVGEVASYVMAAWTVVNQSKGGEKPKKVAERLAKQQKLSPTLLMRWVGYLAPVKNASQKALRPQLAPWWELIALQDATMDLSADEQARAAVQEFADSLQHLAEQVLPQREKILGHFGANLAFVDGNDRAEVPAGEIPLGNLFDDSSAVSLDAAVSSDKFKATAAAGDLGVDRVTLGLEGTLEIADGIRFQFSHLGADGSKHGSVTNDGWDTQGGIRTEGKPANPGMGRAEQGIGMHANALITFDLAEIRRSGLLPADQKFVFIADRAGINDDVAGSPAPSAHLAVILSRPHRKEAVYDAVLAAEVNGKPLKVDENDMVYYFGDPPAAPLTGDGRFVRFEIPVPADARYLTLVTTGAGGGPDGNPINSDHAVFSGARLVLDPPPDSDPLAGKKPAAAAGVESMRDTALLLSWLLYDEGLLGLPGTEVEGKLQEEARQGLVDLRSRQAEMKKEAESLQIQMAHSLTDGKGADLKVYLSGNPENLGEDAPRSLPAIFTAGTRQPFETQGSGRLELARSITSPDVPLTARVIVNRIWKGHFGFGIVRTTSNFGERGDRPSHPELLDYLASQFIKHGWSMKRLHKEIMLSAVYQQGNTHDEKAFLKDPENRLLWKMNRRRLEIEPWRDAVLAVTGELDLTVGGPSIQLSDKNNMRRTIYGFVSRHRLNELLRLFDFPDPNITAANRTTTTVPLQQLFVLNSDFMIDRARSLSKQIQEKAGQDVEQQAEFVCQLLFARSADKEEVVTFKEFLELTSNVNPGEDKLTPLEQLSLALLGSSEFLYID